MSVETVASSIKTPPISLRGLLAVSALLAAAFDYAVKAVAYDVARARWSDEHPEEGGEKAHAPLWERDVDPLFLAQSVAEERLHTAARNAHAAYRGVAPVLKVAP